MDLKDTVRVIENYPKQGISFKDITTLLKDPEAYQEAMKELIKVASSMDFDYILAAEARGFIIGAPLAYELKKGFIPVRKPNKLPGKVLRQAFDLEYGTDYLEIHTDALKAGDKVIVVDDLLATGGTSKAMIEMAEKLGAEVSGALYLIELEELNGRKALDGYRVESVIKY
ncbi:adenine phosphoribosyltransferase [Guggenheimella bovis]